MIFRSTLKSVLFFTISAFTLACTTNIPIAYKLEPQESIAEYDLQEVVLSVLEFEDQRRYSSENTAHFTSGRNCFIAGENMCINAEKHYHKVPPAQQFSMLLTKRFETDFPSIKAMYNNPDSADYYVRGSLVQLNGRQGFSNAAAVGAQFGLVGALATSGARTDGRIVIEINDLTVYDADYNVIRDFGDVYRVYEDEFRADAYCWAIFHNVNDMVKKFHGELVDMLAMAIAEHKKASIRNDD